MEQRLSVQRNMLYNSLGSLFYLACQWLINVLAVRLGSYETGGMLALSVQVTNVFFVIASFSIRVFQASDTTGRFSPSRYVSTRLVTGAAGLGLCVLFSLCSVQYAPMQRLSIILYMLFKTSEVLVDCFAAEQQKAWRMDWSGLSLLMRGVTSLGSFIIGMLVWHSLPAALLLMAVTTMPVVIFYDGRIVARLSPLKLDFSLRRSLPLLKAAWPMMVNSAMMTLLAAVPRYFLELYAGAEVLGIYTAIATPAVIMQAGCSFIYSPLVAPLSESYHRGDLAAFRKTLVRALLAVGLLAAAALLAATLLGRWGLRLLFDDSILPHAHLLVPALAAALGCALIYFFEVPLTIMGRLRSMTVIHLAAMAATVIFSMLLIPAHGMAGVNLVLLLCAGGDALAMGVLALFLSKKNVLPSRR